MSSASYQCYYYIWISVIVIYPSVLIGMDYNNNTSGDSGMINEVINHRPNSSPHIAHSLTFIAAEQSIAYQPSNGSQ